MSNAIINIGTPAEVSVDDCCDSAIAGAELVGDRESHESDEWTGTQDVRCSQCGAEGTFYWKAPSGPFDGGAYAMDGPFNVNVEAAEEREL